MKKLKDFNKDMEDGEYVLLYPDSSQIKNIPGTDTPFPIGQYKEAIGKAYQRILTSVPLRICCQRVSIEIECFYTIYVHLN